MGAQQTYNWCIRFPDMVKRAAVIAGTAKTTPHDFLFTKMCMDTIKSDPAWNHGWYEEPNAVHVGLRRHAELYALMGLCTEFYKKELWTRVGFSSLEDFVVGFWHNWFIPMDPNNLLCMLTKWQNGDVSKMFGGDLKKALSQIKAKVFVMAFEDDMFVPITDCVMEQKMIPNSELRPIPTPWGHFGALQVFPEDKKIIDNILKELLNTKI